MTGFFNIKQRFRQGLRSIHANVVAQTAFSNLYPIMSFLTVNSGEMVVLAFLLELSRKYWGDAATRAMQTVESQYVAFLSAPDHFLHQQEFNQGQLISINNQNNTKLQFPSKGICFGLVMVWHEWLQSGKDLCDELKSIVKALTNKEELPLEQKNLLERINTMQETQLSTKLSGTESLEKGVFFIQDTIKTSQGLKEGVSTVVEQVLDRITRDPGSLIQLNPLNIGVGGHAIGVVAQKTEEDEFVIRYFDPNFREVIFTLDNAVEALTNLILFAYEPIYRQSNGEFILHTSLYAEKEAAKAVSYAGSYKAATPSLPQLN